LVWLTVVVLLWLYWFEWPSWVTWPLAVLEAIFVPDWRTLKPYVLGRKQQPELATLPSLATRTSRPIRGRRR